MYGIADRPAGERRRHRRAGAVRAVGGRPGRAVFAALLLGTELGGCFVDVPVSSSGETASSGSSTTSSSSSSASASAGTSLTTTTTTGSSTAVTVASSSTTAPLTTSSSSSSSSSSDGSSSTTVDLPTPLVLQASVVACVVTSDRDDYVGPDACSKTADEINNTQAQGLAMIDTEMLLLGGGEGRMLMSFDLPPELAQSTIQSANLTVTLADDVQASGPIGDLWQVGTFSMDSLESAGPPLLDLLDASEQLGQANDVFTRPVDASVIIDSLEMGAVHLGLVPTSSDLTIFHGALSALDLQPTLTIFHE